MAGKRHPLSERLRRNSAIDSASGCWVWTARKFRCGYGLMRIRLEGRQHSRLAHRISYETFVGTIPVGFEIDHLCRNRACTNPSHLEAVTRRTNVLRGVSFAAVNAVKMRCTSGHEYSSENTYLRPKGGRDCRACIRQRVAQYKSRRHIEIAA